MGNRHQTIGIFGGTFDPIHFGHLRAILEVTEQLHLNETRLIPCKNPPHRIPPLATGEHRLNMLKIAIKHSPLSIDEQEMQRTGPSYSVDTLRKLKKEHPNDSLCMIIGVDAFLGLPSWHKWEELIQLANIVVMYRAGWDISETGTINTLLKKHVLNPQENIADFKCGKILQHKITSLNISASTIRTLIQEGHSPQFLLPDEVWEYIQEHGLYGYTKSHSRTQSTEIL